MRKIRLISFHTFLLLIFLSQVNCKSINQLQNSKEHINNLRNKIEFHVKCLNDGNTKGLESVYAFDYEGLSPVTKFENKQELINILVENQREQQLKIKIKIIEISAKSTLAYAILDWKAFINVDSSKQQLLYAKKHLQIWELIDNEWQIKRSLFYN